MEKKLLIIILLILTMDIYAIDYFNIEKIKQNTFLIDEKNPFKYQVPNIFDNNPNTVWATNNLSNEKYEFEVTFESPIFIDTVEIAAGYFDNKYYKMNNRIRNIEVIINDKKSFKFELVDEMIFQKLFLKTSHEVNKISFKILSTYSGTKWNDTCISEITFLNKNNIIENGFYQLNNKNLDEIHNYKYNKKGFLIEDKYDYFVKTAGTKGIIKYILTNTGEILSQIDETEVSITVSVYEYKNKLLKTIMEYQTFNDIETYRYRTTYAFNGSNNIISKETYLVEENKFLNGYKYKYNNNILISEEYYTDNRKSNKTYYYDNQGRKSGYYFITDNWENPIMYYNIYNNDLLVAKLVSSYDGKEITVADNHRYENGLEKEFMSFMYR